MKPTLFLCACIVVIISLFSLGATATQVDLSSDPPSYGVDCSYPIHYGINKQACPFFYDQYNRMMQGCYKLYSKAECEQNERERLNMSREQPATQHNYTAIGFKKLKAPKAAWEPLLEFYNQNKDKKVLEKWYRGATIVNTWDSPTYMVSFENPSFRGGLSLKNQIWEGVRPVIEEWVGRKIVPTSLYGIRLYTDKSVLATHVDRLPLVSSCIINVDQDLDEPWPIEVYDHDGQAHNITMEPGDMVLYESSTILHGRPFAMKGRYFANIFVHFEPVDHAEQNQHDAEARALRGEPLSIERRHGRLRSNKSPSKNSEEETFRLAASHGQLDEVMRLAVKNPDLINAADENDWQAIHEAVRGGHLEIVKYLVGQGADISHRVKNGGGALWLAQQHLSATHPVLKYLSSIGAPYDSL